jgi:enamine deaminase RidA (YjgF/YER057c/UK114 family)
MTSVQHINIKAGAEPYKALFSKVTIVPPNTSIAYISTQWACDSETGDLVKGTENDFGKQSKIVWENISATLKELGAEMKDVVHRTVCFL